MKTIILARDVMKKCDTTGCTNLGYQIHSPDPDTAVWLCVRCTPPEEKSKAA